MARIFFGAANPLPDTGFLFQEPTKILSPEQIQAIDALTSYNNVFSPAYEYYYDGPMGNYGANIKARFVGYHIEDSTGLRRALELRQLHVPVITTPDEFKQFIQDTPVMRRSIAIVEHNDVMCEPRAFSNTRFDKYDRPADLFYAVVYEKRAQSDALFIYPSGGATPHLAQVRTYFRPEFFLFTPDKVRQSADISGLYAIQDATNLISRTKVIDTALPNLRGVEHRFYLGETLSYNENSLMHDHAITMLNAIEDANLNHRMDIA